MSKIEKTVFISYRRTNSFHALAIYQALRARGYDVFIDYASIDSGKFDDIILNQIKARAHFIVILTPSALERCDDPNDWVRIEILTALESERNIVPVMFDGFDWKQDVVAKLPDVLRGLSRYNGLPVPASLLYFDMAMELIHSKFLDKPVDVVLHLSVPADKEAIAKITNMADNQPIVTEKQLSADDYFEKGNQYHFNRQYTNSIPEYTESLRLNPHNPTALYRRGIAYERVSQFQLAQADYDQVVIEANTLIQHNPNDAEAYQARGMAYQNGKKDYDRAIADYDEAIRLNPHYVLAYYNRGNAYKNKGDGDSAIANYDEAIRLNPQYAFAYNNRGLAYANKGDYDRAIADYDEAIRLNPHDAHPHTNRGLAYANKSDYDRAIADYDEAIRLNPEYAKAYNHRGTAYVNKGDYDRAIADYEHAMALNPNDELARKNRERAMQKKRGS
jgi:tetratricopeptide (TPR) repeat protein